MSARRKSFSQFNLADALQAAGIPGILTNGSTWPFCLRQATGAVMRSQEYVASDAPKLRGALDYFFARCEENVG